MPTPHPFEVAVPVCAILGALLIIPTIFSQIQAKNFATTVLALSLALVNIRHASNALAFGGARAETWDGKIFCDIQIRVRAGSTALGIGAITCLFQDLAAALRTDRIGGAETRNERIRAWAFRAIVCFIMPVYYISILQVVAVGRYAIMPVVGCLLRTSIDWRTIIAYQMWLALEAVAATVYCGIAMYRLVRHRLAVGAIVTSTRSSRRRYARLFALGGPGLILIMVGNICWEIRNLLSVSKIPLAPNRFQQLANTISKLTLYGNYFQVLIVFCEITFSYLAFVLFGLDTVYNAVRACVARVRGQKRTTPNPEPGVTIEMNRLNTSSAARMAALQQPGVYSDDMELWLDEEDGTIVQA